MTLPGKHQLALLVIFYKSTLTLSIAFSVLPAVINFANALFTFGFCFLSGGTVISLFYKEISRPQEYYFYYNKGIPKTWLIVSCAAGNCFFGSLLIIISHYAKYP